MHPALSVIFFTTLSGAGYGLAFFLSLGLVSLDLVSGWLGWLVAFGLITTGLLSSTLHLGNPQRALWAFTQWRSSWLSREGCMAIITFLPLSTLAYNDLFGGITHIYIMYVSFLGALCCLITVWCTGMIYASLRTIAAWHTVLTPICYCSFSFSSGFLLLTLLTSLTAPPPPDIFLTVSIIVLCFCWCPKFFWWRRLSVSSGNFGLSDISTATGLGDFGSVRLLESPHSMDNYLTREMFFVLARRRRVALRRLAIFFGLVLSLLSVALAFWFVGFIYLAFVFHFLGLLIERWLFFAESRHTVSLYYGATSQEVS